MRQQEIGRAAARVAGDKAAVISNADELLSHGEADLRRVALDIVTRALAAADPYRPALEAITPYFLPGGALGDKGRVLFVGAGKASYRIALAVETLLGERLSDGVVICKQGEKGSLSRIRVRHGAHPVPDAAGAAATAELIALARQAKAGDVIISGFTGGSSALFVAPPPELDLSDIQATTDLLLRCGANINEMNAVRKHMSTVGGGRLAALLPEGVHLIVLTVSDVIGDPLDYITDPVVPDTSTLADARQTFTRYNLWGEIPSRVRTYLAEGGAAPETPKSLAGLKRWEHLLVPLAAASNGAALRATELGFHSAVLTTSLEGESREAGRFLASIAYEIAQHDRPLERPAAIILGGETVVRLAPDVGKGGPNQELAVAAARWLDGLPNVVIAAIGTDGTDGPTDQAGGLVDGTSAEQARRHGLDLDGALAGHASTVFLQAIGDAIHTGSTGTNVSDLLVILVGSGATNGSGRADG